LECSDSELSLLVTNDEHIRELNSQYRSKDTATDVLSFAAREQTPAQMPIDVLGDVVISLETAVEQAKTRELPVDAEIFRLLIHGVLHLLGYDHEGVGDAEVQKMQDLEDSLFDKHCIIAKGILNG
jgi:probable rRNA maturation factor